MTVSKLVLSREQGTPADQTPSVDDFLSKIINYALSSENIKSDLGISGELTRAVLKHEDGLIRSYKETLEIPAVATTAIDTTTTPFENLLRAVRVVDAYQVIINFHRDDLKATAISPIREEFRDHWFVIKKSDLAQSVGAYWALAQRGLLEKVLKFFSATILAKVMKQNELPDEPEWYESLLHLRYIFQSPTWVKFCKLALHNCANQTRYVKFFYNVYQGKNGSLPPSDQFIDQALVKHRKILCEPRENPFSDIQDPFHELIDESICSAALEIFGRRPSQDKKGAALKDAVPPSRIGSLGASYSGPRYAGGAMGEICYLLHREKDVKIGKLNGESVYNCRFSGVSTFLGYSINPTRDYIVTPIYGSIDPDDYEWAEEEALHKSMMGDSSHPWIPGWPRAFVRHEYLKELEAVIQSNPQKMLKAANVICSPDSEAWEQELLRWGLDSDLVQSEVVPLLEAFKVRTITKGNYAKYHLARRWQAKIHRKMRKHPSCQLIGRPCDREVLEDVVLNKQKWVDDSTSSFFVSGDYESATDLLNPWLSTLAQAEIGRNMGIPFEQQIVLDQCLTKHKLVYPQDSGLEDGTQQWGQLMGSPVSFPVLCLINLAATRTSFEIRTGRRYSLQELPMVVNGDDILFRCIDNKHYEIWKQVTARCGLKFSMGKNYTNRRFLVINSELYKVTRNSNARRLPQLNARLLYGGSRSSCTGIDLRPQEYEFSIRSLSGSTDEHRAAYFERALRKLNPKVPPADPETFLVRNKTKIFKGSFANRLENYTRWYKTIPQRQECLLKQLKGDYEVGKEQRDVALRLFGVRQQKRYQSFNKELRTRTRSVHPEMSYYLPQHLGGLGLIPLPETKYTTFDSYLVQILKEQPELADDYTTATSMRLVRADALRAISTEISRVSKKLGLEPTLIPIDEWDEHLERHGDQAPVSGIMSRAHADLGFHATTDDFSLNLEKFVESRSGLAVKKIHRNIEVRMNRRGNKQRVCPVGIDLNTIEIREERLAFNVRRFTPVPLLP